MTHPVTTDLTPATTTLAGVVGAIDDGQLDLATPCAGLTVGDLLHHVEGLALAFTWAATKEGVPEGVDPAPSADGRLLDPAWRSLVPERLGGLAAAWRDPAAWTGRTSVGGVEQSGPECAATCADELVVHAWDLARATGQEVAPDEAAVRLALGFVEAVSAAVPEGVPGLFGPALPVPDGATSLDRLLLLTGRDPAWRP